MLSIPASPTLSSSSRSSTPSSVSSSLSLRRTKPVTRYWAPSERACALDDAAASRLAEGHAWDAQAYSTAAAAHRRCDERAFRIEMAVESWGKALQVMESLELPPARQLGSLHRGRATALLQLAGLRFGTDDSRDCCERAVADCDAALLAPGDDDPQALLLRARAHLMLGCFELATDANDHSTRLRESLADLEALRASSVLVQDWMQAQVAETWLKAAPVIAREFHSHSGFLFPETTGEVVQLLALLRPQQQAPILPPDRDDRCATTPSRRCSLGTLIACMLAAWALSSSRSGMGHTPTCSLLSAMFDGPIAKPGWEAGGRGSDQGMRRLERVNTAGSRAHGGVA